MKVGDLVRLKPDDSTIQQVWVITSVKSNSKGFWIQLDDECPVSGVWHCSNNYEVVSESR